MLIMFNYNNVMPRRSKFEIKNELLTLDFKELMIALDKRHIILKFSYIHLQLL